MRPLSKEQTWRELLQGLRDRTITIDQFKNRRLRARKTGKVQLCLAFARAWELYILERDYNCNHKL